MLLCNWPTISYKNNILLFYGTYLFRDEFSPSNVVNIFFRNSEELPNFSKKLHQYVIRYSLYSENISVQFFQKFFFGTKCINICLWQTTIWCVTSNTNKQIAPFGKYITVFQIIARLRHMVFLLWKVPVHVSSENVF